RGDAAPRGRRRTGGESRVLSDGGPARAAAACATGTDRPVARGGDRRRLRGDGCRPGAQARAHVQRGGGGLSGLRSGERAPAPPRAPGHAGARERLHRRSRIHPPPAARETGHPRNDSRAAHARARSDDGRRVTTPEVAEAVEMVLAGPVNRMLVTALRRAGLDAIGLSGVDGGLLTAQRAPGGLGHVGEIVAVRVSLLHSLLLAGLTPVIAPMAPAAEGGLPFNVNADDAAAAVAGALHAAELLFVSDVPGVTVD